MDDGLLKASEELAEQLQESAEVEELQRYRLDANIVIVWRLRLIISFLLYAIITIIVYIAAPIYVSLSCGLLFFLSLLFGFIRPRFVYNNSSFAFGNEDIRFRTGFLFIKEILVPFSRIQHLDIRQGPIERYFDLSTLIVHTAGQSGDAIKIPGLHEHYAEQLRAYLKSFIKSEEEDT